MLIEPLYFWCMLALSKRYTKIPENHISDVPDFSILPESMPLAPLAYCAFSAPKSELLVAKSWIRAQSRILQLVSSYSVLHRVTKRQSCM